MLCAVVQMLSRVVQVALHTFVEVLGNAIAQYLCAVRSSEWVLAKF